MFSRTRSTIPAALVALSLGACRSGAPVPMPVPMPVPRPAVDAAEATEPPQGRAGLLVMAHGGNPVWDAAVGDAVAPLRSVLPTALALGMADPVTLQAAVDSLEARGVTRIAVVRLFLSGASFLDQTEFLLGLRAAPPAHFMAHGDGGRGAHPVQLAHRAAFLLSREGLSAAEILPDILAARALRMAPSADRPVLVLAHGMGDEAENAELLARMARTADAVRAAGFTRVRAATLREDWPEARARSEADIRSWATAVPGEGGEVVVVPYRLFGFGPYADVLEGIPHRGTEGILPHRLVTQWIREQALGLLCAAGGETPFGPCTNSVAVPG